MTGLLLVQIAVILVAARLCGLLLARLGQPPVIGEMAAGVLLGPVVFGAALPELQAALFPAGSLQGLSALSTLGLVLFMFVIGAELRAPIARFFEDVLVMAEDARVRANRLALLQKTLSHFYRIADISRLGGTS